MKTIHNLNKWSFNITLVFYLTIYLGLMAQIILGCIQILIALYITFYLKLNTDVLSKLKTYWSFVIPYLLSLLFLTDYVDETLLIGIYYALVPMSIAGYFVYITKTLNNEILLLKNKAKAKMH
ncbi:hypothetical protein H0I23_11245 [Cellulophaga sp. HaHaR_3_176]|uniref:hypothetical protein n=1 Tax=Cellulophaga sp. HaHaR_3_176 TaxID=1942464 RepID=UPI001C2014E4|nr:hypothetical protein [Cellulophaga sp. HaHaR_3_176]QWX83034.1 hypothetical protein H0I23_11245 [Cellulophaga sp. HaHaR_3_176]